LFIYNFKFFSWIIIFWNRNFDKESFPKKEKIQKTIWISGFYSIFTINDYMIYFRNNHLGVLFGFILFFADSNFLNLFLWKNG
jgi:hypothetical protein